MGFPNVCVLKEKERLSDSNRVKIRNIFKISTLKTVEVSGYHVYLMTQIAIDIISYENRFLVVLVKFNLSDSKS